MPSVNGRPSSPTTIGPRDTTTGTMTHMIANRRGSAIAMTSAGGHSMTTTTADTPVTNIIRQEVSGWNVFIQPMDKIMVCSGVTDICKVYARPGSGIWAGLSIWWRIRSRWVICHLWILLWKGHIWFCIHLLLVINTFWSVLVDYQALRTASLITHRPTHHHLRCNPRRSAPRYHRSHSLRHTCRWRRQRRRSQSFRRHWRLWTRWFVFMRLWWQSWIYWVWKVFFLANSILFYLFALGGCAAS